MGDHSAAQTKTRASISFQVKWIQRFVPDIFSIDRTSLVRMKDNLSWKVWQRKRESSIWITFLIMSLTQRTNERTAATQKTQNPSYLQNVFRKKILKV